MMWRKMKKRGFAYLLSAIMMLEILPFTGVFGAVARAAEAPAGETVTYLSDLDWVWAYASAKNTMYGDKDKVTGKGLPKKDYRSNGTNQPMYISYDACKGVYNETTIRGKDTTKLVEKGIGTSACSEIVYQLDGSYDTFLATAAFDVYTMGNKNRPSSVQFQVLGSKGQDISSEYQVLYDSGVVYNSDAGGERPYFVPQDIEVSVKDYNYLKLWVWDAGETGTGGTNPTNQSDDVDWAYARLIKKADSQEPEEAYVYLSDMDQKAHTGNEVRHDTSYLEEPIEVGGQAYQKGLGMKADASVSYVLGGGYEYFTAEIGFDPKSAISPVSYEVFGYSATGTKDTITEGTLTKEEPCKSIGGPVTAIETLELVIHGEAGQELYVNWGNAKVKKAVEEVPVELSAITVDGAPLSDFSPASLEYSLVLEDTTVPVVGAEAAEGLHVVVTQAQGIPGDAMITVSDGKTTNVYTIHFTKRAETGITIDLLADQKELNPARNPGVTSQLSVKAYDKNGQQVEIPYNAVIKYSAKDLYKSGDITVASVDAKGVVTPNPTAGGVAQMTASVTFGGNTYTDTVNITVRPFYNDYHQSMVMKMFLGQNGSLRLNLDEGMEVIKKIDNMTLGIPKIIYLVGWQYEGHDSGYPSFAKVNEKLKRAGDASARDSLIWFMEEAKKYNTTVSLHINMLDASASSPLWEEYLEKDIIARNADGSLKTYVWGYPISYTAEWEAGLTTRRIDELLELLPPLKEAGTIHIDAFHTWIPGYTNEPISPYHAENYGYTNEVEAETQRKIFNYWHDNGIDLTSEFVSNYRDEKFIGLQPMAWHFSSFSTTEYLNIPASLYCGGDRVTAVFGENMAGESIIKADKNNLTGFMADFALKSVPFYFLNRFDRLTYNKTNNITTATFSEGVVSQQNADGSLHITQNGIVLRDGTDIFMPALWNESEYQQIFAYSQTGYENRTWTLPEQCADMKRVDIYNINLKDIRLMARDQEVTDGTITLSLGADQAVTIVPAGTQLDPESLERLGDFQLAGPANDDSAVDTDGVLSWNAAINAEDYTVQVATDSSFKKLVLNERVSETSCSIADLVGNTTYYWKVAANRYKDGELYESRDSVSGVWSFRTMSTSMPDTPEGLSAMRVGEVIKVSWQKANGADTYTVYRNDGDGFVLAASGITENSWSDTSGLAGPDSVYYVVAVNSRGESAPSLQVNVLKGNVVYISDLEWKWAYAAARGVMYEDEANIKNTAKPKIDYRYDGNKMPMYISYDPCYNEYNFDNIIKKDSTVFVDKGIGTLAGSEVVYSLDGKYETFLVTPGFEVYALTNKNRPSSVQFKIMASKTTDNSAEYEVLYDSGIIYDSDKDASRPYYVPKEISVSVKDYQYLKLWVSDANEAPGTNAVNSSDVLNWAFARLTEVEEEEENPLETLREAAKKELMEYREAKNQEDYRAAQLLELNTAEEEGQKALDAAASEDEITAALSSAKAALDAVKTARQLEQEEYQAAAEAAAQVDEKIEAIGEVTLESREAIEAVRTAYSELDARARELVTKLELLEAAEGQLAQLLGDAEAAAETDLKIEAIGEVTLDSQEAIEAARAAYQALSDSARGMVTKLDVLEAAEEAFARLQAEEQERQEIEEKAAKAAAEVDWQITAIGNVTLDSKDAIEAARAAYNALDDYAKSMVTKLDALEAAEARLFELQEAQKQEEQNKPEDAGNTGSGNEAETGNEAEGGNEAETGNEAEGGNEAGSGNEAEGGNEAETGNEAEGGNEAGAGNEAESGNEAGAGNGTGAGTGNGAGTSGVTGTSSNGQGVRTSGGSRMTVRSDLTDTQNNEANEEESMDDTVNIPENNLPLSNADSYAVQDSEESGGSDVSSRIEAEGADEGNQILVASKGSGSNVWYWLIPLILVIVLAAGLLLVLGKKKQREDV